MIQNSKVHPKIKGHTRVKRSKGYTEIVGHRKVKRLYKGNMTYKVRGDILRKTKNYP